LNLSNLRSHFQVTQFELNIEEVYNSHLSARSVESVQGDHIFSKKIIVVDDEPFNILGLKNILKICFDRLNLPACSMDKLVDTAFNGQEALDRVKLEAQQGRSYGLIFMDCSMPFMNGYEACSRIRQHYNKTLFEQPYVVACTGHSEEEFIRKAWQNKMDEIIPKPARFEQIMALLTEMIIHRSE